MTNITRISTASFLRRSCMWGGKESQSRRHEKLEDFELDDVFSVPTAAERPCWNSNAFAGRCAGSRAIDFITSRSNSCEIREFT